MFLIIPYLALLAPQETVAHIHDQRLFRTRELHYMLQEQERAAYLESHRSKIAVIPGAISREVAPQLRAMVDRQWNHVNLSYVAELAALGGDGDDLVEIMDDQPTFTTSIVCDGSCPCSEGSFPLGDEDCGLVQRLLQQNVLPLVEQKTKEWKLRDGTDEFDDLLLCVSFVKRYLPGERHMMHPHQDASTLTVNILLSDPDEFEGGFAVYPDSDERMEQGQLTEQEKFAVSDLDVMGRPLYLEHGQDSAVGELIMHRGSMWHGVHVLQPEQSRRYSWIMDFAKSCDDRDTDPYGVFAQAPSGYQAQETTV